MKDRSKELAKLLGIKPKYLYKTLYNEDCFGRTVRDEHILTAKYLINLKRVAGGSNPEVIEVIKVYPDFEKPENFVKLLKLAMNNGYSLVFEEESKEPAEILINDLLNSSWNITQPKTSGDYDLITEAQKIDWIY